LILPFQVISFFTQISVKVISLPGTVKGFRLHRNPSDAFIPMTFGFYKVFSCVKRSVKLAGLSVDGFVGFSELIELIVDYQNTWSMPCCNKPIFDGPE